MSVPRLAHSATLLPDGRVVVIGGRTGFSSYSNTAEVYDPENDTWTVLGTLLEQRDRHTATLLASGDILVVGGMGSPDGVSAEILNTRTGESRAIEPSPAPREDHSATLLSDGTVLIAGGNTIGPGGVVDATELFDPSIQKFKRMQDMPLATWSHTATLLLDGKVLFAGGDDGNHPPGMGGPWTGLASPLTWLFDPTDGTWSYGAQMGLGRWGHTANRLADGSVVLIGGLDMYGYRGIQIYDSEGQRKDVGQGGRLPAFHTATVLKSGDIWLSSGLSTSSLVFQSGDHSISKGPDLIFSRMGTTATKLHDGRVLIAGGSESSAEGISFFRSVEICSLSS